ncbi:dihydrolipoamide dehydrogenase [Nonlabens dokdonensis]|uniref:Dihydrolipoamide dehydrogenase n=1 Tax=Nonlabens dokdonensis TaxID=328515 RepID=A0A1Z8ARQ4_9FLAO|nr:collagen-like protein [Nonlabens dokdonensis]OUS12963.1 dihydrolipoamide dehydrogenase [Nonlabens dokdonensis]
MKYITLLFALAITLTACEGPQGPPGFDGFDGANGADGVNIVAQSFESTVDFFAPDYEVLIDYPANITVFPDDMTLVYILWDQVPGNNGGLVDVWRLLPQTIYTNFGEFQYNYDATNGDARIFIDAPSSTDLSQLAPGDISNQTFRIVILPVELQSSTIDVTNYDEVMSISGLQQKDIIKID